MFYLQGLGNGFNFFVIKLGWNRSNNLADRHQVNFRDIRGVNTFVAAHVSHPTLKWPSCDLWPKKKKKASQERRFLILHITMLVLNKLATIENEKSIKITWLNIQTEKISNVYGWISVNFNTVLVNGPVVVAVASLYRWTDIALRKIKIFCLQSQEQHTFSFGLNVFIWIVMVIVRTAASKQSSEACQRH